MKKQRIAAFILVLFLSPFSVWGWGVVGMSGSPPEVTWDLLNEDCSDISDWIDDDTDTGVSEVSPAGQFRFDTNAGAAGNASAYRQRDIGSIPNTFTCATKTYSDDIGTEVNTDQMSFKVYQADERLNVFWASDGLFVKDTGSGTVEIGTDVVLEAGSAEWQYWRFLVTFTGVTGNGTCDIYYKNENTAPTTWTKIGTGINCSDESGGTDGTVLFWLGGYTTDNMVFHTDYVKIATGLYIP